MDKDQPTGSHLPAIGKKYLKTHSENLETIKSYLRLGSSDDIIEDSEPSLEPVHDPTPIKFALIVQPPSEDTSKIDEHLTNLKDVSLETCGSPVSMESNRAGLEWDAFIGPVTARSGHSQSMPVICHSQEGKLYGRNVRSHSEDLTSVIGQDEKKGGKVKRGLLKSFLTSTPLEKPGNVKLIDNRIVSDLSRSHLDRPRPTRDELSESETCSDASMLMDKSKMTVQKVTAPKIDAICQTTIDKRVAQDVGLNVQSFERQTSEKSSDSDGTFRRKTIPKHFENVACGSFNVNPSDEHLIVLTENKCEEILAKIFDNVLKKMNYPSIDPSVLKSYMPQFGDEKPVKPSAEIPETIDDEFSSIDGRIYDETGFFQTSAGLWEVDSNFVYRKNRSGSPVTSQTTRSGSCSNIERDFVTVDKRRECESSENRGSKTSTISKCDEKKMESDNCRVKGDESEKERLKLPSREGKLTTKLPKKSPRRKPAGNDERQGSKNCRCHITNQATRNGSSSSIEKDSVPVDKRQGCESGENEESKTSTSSKSDEKKIENDNSRVKTVESEKDRLKLSSREGKLTTKSSRRKSAGNDERRQLKNCCCHVNHHCCQRTKHSDHCEPSSTESIEIKSSEIILESSGKSKSSCKTSENGMKNDDQHSNNKNRAEIVEVLAEIDRKSSSSLSRNINYEKQTKMYRHEAAQTGHSLMNLAVFSRFNDNGKVLKEKSNNPVQNSENRCQCVTNPSFDSIENPVKSSTSDKSVNTHLSIQYFLPIRMKKEKQSNLNLKCKCKCRHESKKNDGDENIQTKNSHDFIPSDNHEKFSLIDQYLRIRPAKPARYYRKPSSKTVEITNSDVEYLHDRITEVRQRETKVNPCVQIRINPSSSGSDRKYHRSSNSESFSSFESSNDEVQVDRETLKMKAREWNMNIGPLQEYLIAKRPNFVKSADERRKFIVNTYQNRNEYKRERNENIRRMTENDRFEKCDVRIKGAKSNGNRVVLNRVKRKQIMFTTRTMKQMTASKYRGLNEVKNGEVEKAKHQEAQLRRLMTQVFKKKLLQRVRNGQLTFSFHESIVSVN